MSARSVVVVGAGLVGSRRAEAARAHPRTRLVGVCDVDVDRARAAARAPEVAVSTDWERALMDARPDLVVVSTPNRELMPVARAAMELGADVLVEKPFGRDLAEAQRMTETARHTGRTLWVGFNHRYVPMLAHAQRLVHEGAIGRVHAVRCVYGHGGRSGYETEWRADPEAAGGGELLDQGVHVIDLLCQLLGTPSRVFAETTTVAWPMSVEDNAFATLRWSTGTTAQFHTSWSQWQNRFTWQVYGERGAVEVDGLTGSYGEARGTVLTRVDGAAPTSEAIPTTEGPDSWTEEWDALQTVLDRGGDHQPALDALTVMRVVDALYRSAREQRAIEIAGTTSA